MFLKPKNGKKIPDPQRGDMLPETGRNIDINQYWQRRLNDDDVEEVKPDKPKKEK